jgi:hypothetical protein
VLILKRNDLPERDFTDGLCKATGEKTAHSNMLHIEAHCLPDRKCRGKLLVSVNRPPKTGKMISY